MAIGFHELMVLLVLSGGPILLIVVGVLLVIRWSKRSRPVGDRLAELESLRRGGQINADEYEKQRATIIASV